MPRVIYELMFVLEGPLPQIVEAIVGLNCHGQCAKGRAKPVPPKQRIIDLRVGDWLRFRNTVRKITAIEALHDAGNAFPVSPPTESHSFKAQVAVQRAVG
jgi:hypothetical protein